MSLRPKGPLVYGCKELGDSDRDTTLIDVNDSEDPDVWYLLCGNYTQECLAVHHLKQYLN